MLRIRRTHQTANLIKQECNIDPATPLGKAVQMANEVLGIENSGPLAQQVAVLMRELGLSEG